MNIEATSTFHITGWDEQPYQALADGAKLTRAKVTQSYQGIITGTSALEYLMAYASDGTASFVGIEHVTGEVADKAGSFIIQHIGTFEGGKARSAWRVIAGAGTGALAALRGEGAYVAGHGEPATVTFRYSFEPRV